MASIRKTDSSTWQVRYRDPNGHQHARNFGRKTDASRFAHSVETDTARGDWLDPRLAKVTFEEWADEWLTQLGHLKPKTRRSYETSLRCHVLPLLGDAKVGTLDRSAIRRFTSQLAEGGAGPAVVQVAVQVTRHVLNLAVEGGALRANPALALRLAKSSAGEKLFLTPEQVSALADAIRPEMYATLIRFAAYTGLRAGEIGALRLGRLDMLGGTVEVAESLADLGGHLEFGATKNYARRHVPLPPFLRDELGEYIALRRRNTDDLVFSAPRGGPLRHGLFYRRAFKPAVLAAGLSEGLRFHDLRHTYAAFCIASTADPYAVMRRMGHSSITVTYNTYGHLFPERDAEITDRLEDLFRRADVDSLWTRPATTGSVSTLT